MHRISAGFDLRYGDSRLPMLVEADGYHHLSRAQELVAGTAAWVGEPALSALGALLHLATRLPLELVAFWLPVGIAMASGIWFWGWGRLLGVPTGYAAWAAFVGSVIPAWFLRASPGWFDTDPGIAFFWHGSLLATACLGLAPACPRSKDLLLLVVCTLCLGWWWKPGLLMLPLCLLLWGATYRFAEARLWRRIRLATCVAIGLGCCAVLLLPEPWLPKSIAHILDYAKTHAAMTLGGTEEVVFLSIAELRHLTVLEVAQGVGGNAAGGVLALCATLLLVWHQPRRCLYFLPSFLALGLALMAERFLFFAALPVALGVGLLPWQLSRMKERPWLGGLLSSAKNRAAIGWVVSFGIVAGLFFWLCTYPLQFSFQAPQDRIALTLRRIAPPEAKVWNWWDDGYFLAARSGHVPLFDGGSQTSRMSYVAAHPLVSDDPELARRWIRFFALRGKEALPPLQAAWGDEASIWRNLDTVFSARDARAALAFLPPLAPGADWLFPAGRVFLYLPQRFLKLSKWWVALGGSPSPDIRTLRPHIDTFERTSFRYVPGQAQVDLPEAVLKKGYADFGGVFLTSRTPLTAPWGGGAPGPYVVTSALSPWLYIVDEQAIGSVAFRLLAPGGERLPGFAPVVVNYAYGGLWEVLP